MELLAPHKTKKNMETKNLINAINIDNIYNRAQIYFRVERFARATWGGLTVEINEKTGTLTLLKGSYILSRVASFEILANQEGDNIYLQAGEGSPFSSAWVVRGNEEGADVMNDCPAWKAAEAAACENETKPFDSLQVGDFLHGWAGWSSKNGSVSEYMEDFASIEEDSDGVNFCPNLMRIDKIVEMTDKELSALSFWKFNGGVDGGSFSDDAPAVGFSALSWSQKHSFIDSVCLIRTPTRWVAVDPQGYTCSRYVYFPLSWRVLFADSYSLAKTIREERKRKEQEEKEARDKAQREEYAARAARAVALMEKTKAKVYQEDEKRTEVRLTSNLRRYLSVCFPAVKFEIKKSSWGYFSRTIRWAGGPTEKEVNEVLEVMKGDHWAPEEGYNPGEERRYLSNDFTDRYGFLIHWILYRD